MSNYRSSAFASLPHECDACKATDSTDNPLQVHHVDRDRKNNDIDNLRILCRRCHVAIHAGEPVGHDTPARKQSLAFYPRDLERLEQLRQRLGARSLSEALRRAIRAEVAVIVAHEQAMERRERAA